MSNVGDSEQQFVDSQGWLEPFRVFFDRTFPSAFLTARDLADGDGGKAARICAHAFARAYSRWGMLGRIGDAEAYVHRQLRRSARRTDETPPVLDAGVGFKPWVYVAAIESGATRKRAVRALSAAGATAAFLVLALPALSPAPKNDVVSIRTESGSVATTTPTTTSVAPTTTLPRATSSAVPTTRPSPVGPELDPEAIERATEAAEDTGFTLDLSGLPTSPDQISPPDTTNLDESP